MGRRSRRQRAAKNKRQQAITALENQCYKVHRTVLMGRCNDLIADCDRHGEFNISVAAVGLGPGPLCPSCGPHVAARTPPTFPDEIMLMIFDYVPPAYESFVRQVCQHWRDIGNTRPINRVEELFRQCDYRLLAKVLGETELNIVLTIISMDGRYDEWIKHFYISSKTKCMAVLERILKCPWQSFDISIAVSTGITPLVDLAIKCRPTKLPEAVMTIATKFHTDGEHFQLSYPNDFQMRLLRSLAPVLTDPVELNEIFSQLIDRQAYLAISLPNLSRWLSKANLINVFQAYGMAMMTFNIYPFIDSFSVYSQSDLMTVALEGQCENSIIDTILARFGWPSVGWYPNFIKAAINDSRMFTIKEIKNKLNLLATRTILRNRRSVILPADIMVIIGALRESKK